jgi:predicted transcriptional regulator of viral defense system
VGKIKHLNKIREFLKSTPIFRAKDVELIVKDNNYSNLILHNLVKRGEIKRVTKGWYSSCEDPVVSVFCFRPAYIGLQDALSIHELWEQETNVVIVTTRKVRTGLRKIMGSNVILHRINQKFFFGIESLKYGDFFVPVSDVEKTLIDLIYFNEIPEMGTLREIKKRTNEGKLKSYLKYYPIKFRRRVEKLLSEF